MTGNGIFFVVFENSSGFEKLSGQINTAKDVREIYDHNVRLFPPSQKRKIKIVKLVGM